METVTLLKGGGVSGRSEQLGARLQNVPTSKRLSWWKQLLEAVKANFNAPFQSDWENTTGLHWKEWGKL